MAKTERAIHGIAASQAIVDRSRDGTGNHQLLIRGMLMMPVPLLLNHTGEPIGRVSCFRVLDGGRKLYCIASVHSDEVWEQIKAYKLRALSVGYTLDHHEIKLDEEKGIVKVIDRSRIREVSVVATPLDPSCYLKIFSGDGSEGRVEGLRPLSEHRAVHERAKAQLARLNKQYPRKTETVAKTKSSKWMTRPRGESLIIGTENLDEPKPRKLRKEIFDEQ